MKDKLKGLLLGIFIGSLITGGSVMAANYTSIKVVIKSMGIYFDGTKKTSAKAIIYNGTTYVPVRSVSDAIGKTVGLVNENLYIGTQPNKQITEDEAIELVFEKIKNDAIKYNLHFMIDGTENNKHVIRVFEDLDDHIATYGWYYVNKSTGKVTKIDIVSGEEVEL